MKFEVERNSRVRERELVGCQRPEGGLVRHGKTGGAGRVWVGSIRSRVKTSHGSNGLQVESGCESGRVDPYFSNNLLLLLFFK